MAGDTANADLWANADVYIAPTGTTGPSDVTTPYAAGWSAVGLLDGAEGLTETRDHDSNEFFAWGGVLVKKTKSKFKRTIKFVALEDNETVFGLVNPGSTRTKDDTTGLTTSVVKVPQSAEFAISFEVRDGDKIKRRTVLRADVEEIGDIKEGEEDLTVYEITVTLYPEADGTLYTELEGPATPAA